MTEAAHNDAPGAPDDTLLLSLADYERAAHDAVSPDALGYIQGGAGDEITVADNLAAWNRTALRPRMLVGAGTCDPGVTVLGSRRPHPVIVAPTAFQRLAHPDGEIGIARAAAATGTIMCVSTLASAGAASVAEAVPGGPRWFQLYVFTDRGVTRELVANAVEHGYEAVVVTADRPVLGVRERELRSNVRGAGDDAAAPDAIAAPGEVTAPSPQRSDAIATPPGTPAEAARAGRGMRPADYSALIDPDLRWDDIERLASECPLPVLVKGILTPEDAELAIAHGAAGVIVSNHGGRQLDTVLSGADALAPIADAVAGRIDVLVDGGVRRGTDVVKALALGADAVLVGRPLTYGLAIGGAQGAQRVLEILVTEVENALALTGCPRATDLDRSFVTPAPWAVPPR
ncbi:MAG TPA: alpha-hydroxy acid oxidase [Solirubrobacteraceae bacterium]|nr:alpha-hydroxy acid oxidase [Solirubrobacteraceae bacterium]